MVIVQSTNEDIYFCSSALLAFSEMIFAPTWEILDGFRDIHLTYISDVFLCAFNTETLCLLVIFKCTLEMTS